MESIQILLKNIFLMIFALFKNLSDLAIEIRDRFLSNLARNCTIMGMDK